MSVDLNDDFYQPSEEWPKEAVDVYNELNKLTKDGKWLKMCAPHQDGKDVRSFVRATGNNTYSGAMFINKEEKLGKGVIVFQKWSEGAKGIAHGGAIATIYDALLGTLVSRAEGSGVTANLNINYRSPLQMYTVVCMEANIDRVEGRKIYLNAVMRSTDGKIHYSDATALFVKIQSRQTQKL